MCSTKKIKKFKKKLLGDPATHKASLGVVWLPLMVKKEMATVEGGRLAEKGRPNHSRIFLF
jgi:hypothetical protein